jgi:hypothetical protein
LLFDPEAGEQVRKLQLPLGVFVSEDLLELADAHRCYHFVVEAEEEGKARVLVSLS